MKLQEMMYDLPDQYQELGKRDFSGLSPEEQKLALQIIKNLMNKDESEASKAEGRKPRFYKINSQAVKIYAKDHQWEWVFDDWFPDGWCFEYD